MRHHFLCTETSVQELCIPQAGGPLRQTLVPTELQVTRTVCLLWVLLGEMFGNVWDGFFLFQAIAPRMQAACCSCKEEGRDPSRASSHPVAPLLYQAPSPPLVLKGISRLQHSLSISSKESAVPNTRARPHSAALEFCFDRKCWQPVWQGTAGVGLLTWAPHPKCFPVLTPLPRLQCDRGRSLQALARTLCCPSEGLGLSYRVQV